MGTRSLDRFLGMEMWLTSEKCFSPVCLPAKFGHSGTSYTGLIMEILEIIQSRRPPPLSKYSNHTATICTQSFDLMQYVSW